MQIKNDCLRKGKIAIKAVQNIHVFQTRKWINCIVFQSRKNIFSMWEIWQMISFRNEERSNSALDFA